jgi:hypothetical protein
MEPLLPTLNEEPARGPSTRPPDPLPHSDQILLTAPQVARLLGMTPKAIYHRARRGPIR